MNKIVLLTFALALTSLPLAAGASDEARGRELINSLGCKGCHKVEGSGGSVGPALDGVGKRLKEEQIRQKLVDPKAGNSNSMMPSFQRLPEQDLHALVDYLEDLK